MKKLIITVIVFIVMPLCCAMHDVIVVGAGIAGLAAAHELKQAGYDVIVVEGNDRIGGRIWTDRSTFEVPVNYGAAWIHGIKKNPMYEISQDLNLRISLTDYNSILLFNEYGQRMREEQLERYEELQEEFDDFLDEKGEILSPENDQTVRQAVNEFIQTNDLNEIDTALLNAYVTSEIEGDESLNAEKLSLYTYVEVGDAGFGGKDVLIIDGYDHITNHLAEAFDHNIRLNEKVTNIAYDEDGVKVTTESNEFRSRYVICTVPLGVLKGDSITFTPALDNQKKGAIDRLAVGLLNKIILQFPYAFWDQEYEWIGKLNRFHPTLNRWFNGFICDSFYIQQPIITAFIIGDQAWALESKSDDEIIEIMMSQLKSMYGDDIPEPTNYVITRWGQNPFAYGSYSSVPIGATFEDFGVIAQPIENRLFFAGEATHKKYPATTHGAYLSGIREAQRIIQLGLSK